MDARFGYKYAQIMANGLCRGIKDTTVYILDRLHVPVADHTLPYAMKYYYPIPDEVTSFDDFQGLWYADAAHTVLVPELNGQ